ncbi:hypothetical protein B484DRAFT_257203 [Ochromonadaceae sp. CCMP2298]|nr:hypothetical protein B484DRAFT_257203 [Ochromonadaceae sp. CCMP2298]
MRSLSPSRCGCGFRTVCSTRRRRTTLLRCSCARTTRRPWRSTWRRTLLLVSWAAVGSTVWEGEGGECPWLCGDAWRCGPIVLCPCYLWCLCRLWFLFPLSRQTLFPLPCTSHPAPHTVLRILYPAPHPPYPTPHTLPPLYDHPLNPPLYDNPLNPPPGLTKIISLNEVKKNYKRLQDLKKLKSEHTHFACDSRIAPQV